MRRIGYKKSSTIVKMHVTAEVVRTEKMKSFLVPAYAAILLVSFVSYCSADHDLETEYSFSATLHNDYKLYWSYDLAAETIRFAVRVRTEGWVGFGLSPNGQMPGSDVVIGWVTDQGEVVFHVSVKHAKLH